jgi:chorismate dehydratase
MPNRASARASRNLILDSACNSFLSTLTSWPNIEIFLRPLLNWFLTFATKPRVSVVSYLNTAPLVWGMAHGNQSGLFDLSFAIPAECADRLESGLADIGIVPAVELNRQKLEIIRGAGIACHGPVRSIFLISKVPYARIRKLATDSTSRTSVALSRVILARKYGVEPEVHSHAPHLPSMLENADAALIIGDAALVLDPADLPFHVLDLGDEWVQLTGLPMVFAVWAARAELPAQDPKPFLDSMRYGLAHIDDIARSEHAKVGVSEDLARSYLKNNIVFELGDREYAGLKTFLQYASELGGPQGRPAKERKVSV